jgi:hypothetical protein
VPQHAIKALAARVTRGDLFKLHQVGPSRDGVFRLLAAEITLGRAFS